MKRFFFGFMLLTVTLSAFATGESAAVVYNGRTRVNSDTLKFMQRYFRNAGISMNPVAVGSGIEPGEYDSVVVLSTGYTQGIDPELQSFIEHYEAPNEILLVTLEANTQSMYVDVVRASDNSLGVDAVTSASLWASRGGSGSRQQVEAMHYEWVSEVIDLIQGT